ncbi:hypothetical protein [uncultured Devosia sp.]|uniref:hypothetical protein n=1 Tax=uncultured Devosia sp. TaxID=211434 RepID=UPI0035CB10F3
MKANDVNWFRPLWRRVTVTGFLMVWCAWEWLWNKDELWGSLISAALAYSIYSFFYAFPKDEPDNGNDTQPPSAP